MIMINTDMMYEIRLYTMDDLWFYVEDHEQVEWISSNALDSGTLVSEAVVEALLDHPYRGMRDKNSWRGPLNSNTKFKIEVITCVMDWKAIDSVSYKNIDLVDRKINKKIENIFKHLKPEEITAAKDYLNKLENK